jgi:Virulence-associated protein E
MPVILSVIQGIGKTKFVLRFLAPIQELATPPALLSDFIDKRSGDLYSYPVVFVDDLEKIERKDIPTLNAIVTSERNARRILGTSRLGHRQQLATLIGTANREIAELIEDETGNRRFVTMRLRNGEVKKGGDPAVWNVIDTTDYNLLWRSVDPFDSDPTDPFLEQLFALQESTRKLSELEAWLLDLDLTSEAVKAITTPKGVKAGELYRLFNEQAVEPMTLSAFGNAMRSYFGKPKMPFKNRTKETAGMLYVVR